jgi:hypothetical protein
MTFEKDAGLAGLFICNPDVKQLVKALQIVIVN